MNTWILENPTTGWYTHRGFARVQEALANEGVQIFTVREALDE